MWCYGRSRVWPWAPSPLRSCCSRRGAARTPRARGKRGRRPVVGVPGRLPSLQQARGRGARIFGGADLRRAAAADPRAGSSRADPRRAAPAHCRALASVLGGSAVLHTGEPLVHRLASGRGTYLLLALVVLGVLAACVRDDHRGDEPPASPAANDAPAVGDAGPIHVHALGVNPADGAPFIAPARGSSASRDPGARPECVADRYQDTMGFTVIGADRFLASGHPDGRGKLPPFLGLIESTDAGENLGGDLAAGGDGLPRAGGGRPSHLTPSAPTGRPHRAAARERRSGRELARAASARAADGPYRRPRETPPRRWRRVGRTCT
jgi:hypothetical protein